MLRKDYLVRMIEEMTDVLSKVFQLKQQNKLLEAQWELDELYKRQFRLNSSLLGTISAKDITDLFRHGEELEADKLQSLARLLQEEADLYNGTGNLDEGVSRWMKSLHLYLTASLNNAERSLWDIDGEVEQLLSHLRKYRLPLDTERLLFKYEEEIGAFDQAENVLYRLLEAKAIAIEDASAFYERLLGLDPKLLEEGGLPLEEVKEGLEELHHRFI